MYAEYTAKLNQSSGLPGASEPSGQQAKSATAAAPKKSSMLAAAVSSVASTAHTSELDHYLSGAYPTSDEDGALEWWKVRNDTAVTVQC